MTRMRLRAPTQGTLRRMRRIAERLVKVAEYTLHFIQAISRLFENSHHAVASHIYLGGPLGHARH